MAIINRKTISTTKTVVKEGTIKLSTHAPVTVRKVFTSGHGSYNVDLMLGHEGLGAALDPKGLRELSDFCLDLANALEDMKNGR